MNRYDFTPFPDRVAREPLERRIPDVSSDLVRGRLGIRYRAQQPIHVGTGFKRVEGDRLLSEGYRSGDRPAVSGASFRGALRSRYEAATRSCILLSVVPDDRRSGSFRIRSSTGATRALLSNHIEHTVLRPLDRCTPQSLCPACALFGTMSLRGRVSVGDLVCDSDFLFEMMRLPLQFAPNIHHVGRSRPDPNDRSTFLVDSLLGRKFAVTPAVEAEQGAIPCEVIPRGAALSGVIRFERATAAELGGLLVAIGHTPKSVIRVGRAKGHGLGELSLESIDLTLDRATGSDQAFEEWRRAFVSSEDRWSDGEDALVRIHSGTVVR